MPENSIPVLKWGFIVGGIAFAVTFVGAMILNRSSGNGPLLAFVVGPFGFVVGIVVGLIRRDLDHRKRQGAP